MSNIKTLLDNALKNAEITDYIIMVRGGCYTVITVENFIKDIVFGGQLICDTLLGCWKTMGQFDGGINQENSDDEPCNCDPNFVKIHFPKGEGIKIITNEDEALIPDSIYPIKVGSNEFQLVIVDEDGNKRNLIPATQVNINIESSDDSIDVSEIEGGGYDLNVLFPIKGIKSSSDIGIPMYDGLDETDKYVKLLPLISDTIKFERKVEDGKAVLRGEIIQAADENLKQFYVNENYPFTGNGSISKPYSKLTNALKEIIGSGSLINPQYKNAKIILQSSVEISQADLDATPALYGGIVVNTTTISSEDKFTIKYKGNTNYPLSTSILKTRAIAESFTGELFIVFKNVNISSETVKGLVHLKTFTDSYGRASEFVDFSVNGNYFTSGSYVQLMNGGSPITLFGQAVYGNNNITNEYPTVLIEGRNSNGQGAFSLKGEFSITGTNQTYLKIDASSVSMETLILNNNPFYESIDNLTSKNPKTGIYRLEILNSFLNISKELRSDNSISPWGGNDGYIRYLDDGSYADADLKISKGSIFNARFNKILSLKTSTGKNITLNNCDWTNTTILTTALFNENGLSPIRNITAENSYIHEVQESSSCGIKINAILAFINYSQYTTQAPYDNVSNNDTEAKGAGKIIGNVYQDLTNKKLKVIQ